MVDADTLAVQDYQKELEGLDKTFSDFKNSNFYKQSKQKVKIHILYLLK